MILIALIFHCASSKSIGVFEDLFLSNSRLTAEALFYDNAVIRQLPALPAINKR